MLSHITIFETAVSGDVAMTIINPRKEYWPSQGSNLRPPVLKPATLSTELWGSADEYEPCTHICIRLCSLRKGLDAFAKSIDSCQPAQSAQADKGQCFSLCLNLLVKGPFYIMDQSVARKKKRILLVHNLVILLCTMHHGASLTPSQTTNFRVFYTEKVCRRQFQI